MIQHNKPVTFYQLGASLQSNPNVKVNFAEKVWEGQPAPYLIRPFAAHRLDWW